MSKRRVVIDTNVIATANGHASHVDAACQLACIESLENTSKSEVTLLDDTGKIMSEYGPYVSHRGEPGPGDAFFVFIFNNQHDEDLVRKVPIRPNTDASRGYDELPSNNLKIGDRTILATAVSGNGEIHNATDSDWAENASTLEELNVRIKQVCPKYATRA